MVRFHWHVEQGYSAYMPPDGVTFSKESQAQHASCEVEVCSSNKDATSCEMAATVWKLMLQIPGQKETLPAIFTLPPDHLQLDKVTRPLPLCCMCVI